MKPFVSVVLAMWLALALVLGASGAFVAPLGVVPVPIALGVAVPLIVFLTALWVSTPFRAYVMAGDLPLATAVQAWRFAGAAFLALYAHGVLPGVFIWPAGLGDMAIGLTAPWIALALIRRRGFAASRLFVVWNLLGILDLVVAVSIAALNATFATGEPGEITVAPMAQMPLVLVPTFLVPLFIMLHLTALFQARRLALADRSWEPAPRADYTGELQICSGSPDPLSISGVAERLIGVNSQMHEQAAHGPESAPAIAEADGAIAPVAAKR